MLNKSEIIQFERKYVPEYYLKNPKNIEDYIVTQKLEKGVIDKYVVAWKAGRLSANTDEKISSDEELNLYVKKFEKNGNYLNGYGKPINKGLLDAYIDDLNATAQEQMAIIDRDGEDAFTCFSKLYDIFLKKMPKVKEKRLPNFGTVYLINLIYFRSEGKLPIYDQFAHKAVKALFAKTTPDNIYIGPAPGKEEQKKVNALYREYLWLLDKVFGKIEIERKLDQALWFYGHESKAYRG